MCKVSKIQMKLFLGFKWEMERRDREWSVEVLKVV